jgi:hypothetical protein
MRTETSATNLQFAHEGWRTNSAPMTSPAAHQPPRTRPAHETQTPAGYSSSTWEYRRRRNLFVTNRGPAVLCCTPRGGAPAVAFPRHE